MAQTNFGTVGPFNPGVEDWISYEQHFKFYLTANDVAFDKKQRAIFVTTCGATTYSLVCSLAVPKRPSELTFAEIIKLAAEHYHLNPSLAVQSFKFNYHSRQAGESVAACVAELKR